MLSRPLKILEPNNIPIGTTKPYLLQSKALAKILIPLLSLPKNLIDKSIKNIETIPHKSIYIPPYKKKQFEANKRIESANPPPRKKNNVENFETIIISNKHSEAK